MSRDVNPPRKYDASRRQEQSRATRRAILSAATEMFVEQGYAATTVRAIAEASGVSVETVYKAFGNKPGIVKACFDVAIVGDDEAIPMMERPDGFVARNRAEQDPRNKLMQFGAHAAEAMRATGRIQLAVKAAAATDSGAAEVWAQLLQERLTGMTAMADHLKARKMLRRGVSAAEARDVLWTFLAVEMWDLLVNTRGWTDRRFAHWVGQQLIAALL
jgi:AcrR family transcriptional regulator